MQTWKTRFQTLAVLLVTLILCAALPASVTVNQEGLIQGFIKVVCGKSGCYAINASLSVAITPAA